MMFRQRTGLLSLFLVGLLTMSPVLALADDSQSADTTSGGLKQTIDDLNAQVKDKESQVKDLDAMIQKYKAKITEQDSAVASLQNEVGLLDNRIEENQLAIERTKSQIDLANLEISNTQIKIQLEQKQIDEREASLAELLRRIQESDHVNTVDVFLTRPSLSEFLSQVEELKKLEQDMADATREVKDSKDRLEAQKKDIEAQRLALQDHKTQLQKEQVELEGNHAAKASLISETQSQEDEFQHILYELRQEQQQTASGIADLQDKLKEQLDNVDSALARGDILLNWPVRALRGISAFFHDPSYPFRNLFEHPGVDIPTSVGTPVHAAAGGYVAWNRTGKQYGNYVMLVHPGGIATVYAHLSRFGAKPDTYVERGDIIGYSGGHPGDEGAGLSTGAHLHFEVRQNGIPVNPMNFLPSLD